MDACAKAVLYSASCHAVSCGHSPLLPVDLIVMVANALVDECTCASVQARLDEYVDALAGTSGGPAAATDDCLSSHLATCHACRAVARHLLSMLSRLHEIRGETGSETGNELGSESGEESGNARLSEAMASDALRARVQRLFTDARSSE